MTEIQQAVLKYSQLGYQPPGTSTPLGEVPFITGELTIDYFLYHMNRDHGIKVTLEPRFLRRIKTVEVVDPKLAAWFLLQWQ